jgi:hypothetical protein
MRHKKLRGEEKARGREGMGERESKENIAILSKHGIQNVPILLNKYCTGNVPILLDKHCIQNVPIPQKMSPFFFL